MTDPTTTPPAPLVRRPGLWLAIAVGLTCLQLGRVGLFNPDEGRYAEMGRAMLTGGDWLVPRLNGIPHWAKPPLAVWLTAASMKVFGINEFAARLPSALGAAITLLATFALARRLVDASFAALSVAILASMIEFRLLGRLISPDMLQTAMITLAMLGWHVSRVVDAATGRVTWKPWPLLLAFTALGVSFVDKGPVALAVLATTLLAFSLLARTARVISPRLALIGLAIIAAIGLPWYLAVTDGFPELRQWLLGHEVVDRISNSRHSRTQPAWFFVVVLLVGLLPWTPVALTGLGRAVRGATNLRWLAAWVLGPFVMFSVVPSKLPTYILPVFPAAAMLTAHVILAATRAPENRAVRRMLAIVAGTPVVLLAGLLVVGERRFEIVPPSLVALAAIVAAYECLAWTAARATPTRRPVVMVAGIASITVTVLAVMIATMTPSEENLRAHAPWRWLSAATAGHDLHGIPLDRAFHPSDQKAVLPRGVPRLVNYAIPENSLSFYTLRERAEVLPMFAFGRGWELEVDQKREVVSTIHDLVAELRGPDETWVVLYESALGQLREQSGLPLPVLARGGLDERAGVLVRNR